MQVLKDSSAYRLALKEKIMDTAMQAFIRQGIRAVRMDDIAQQLGISKRTLYEIYEDKEELLLQSIKKYNAQRVATLTEYAAQGHNVIDVVLEAYRLKLAETRMVNPVFFSDIIKYPKVDKFIKDTRERFRDKFVLFINKGIQEGYFKKSKNLNLIPLLMDAVGDYIMSNQLLQQYPVEELFDSFYLLPLRGLCTEQGVRKLDEAIAKIL